MEKKAVLGTISWNKCYCHYRRDDGQGGRVFCMIPYNQVKRIKYESHFVQTKLTLSKRKSN